MHESSLAEFIKSSRGDFETKLCRLVEIPTISADPGRESDFHAAALLAAGYLEEFGAESAIHQTGGHPVVVGKFSQPDARKTLTIYNHLDVQPAEEPEWKRASFVFAREGDKYFGRGTTDDKGPALTALFAARYAMESKIPLNIQFVWEFEEEIGSPHFEEFLQRNAPSLKSDSVMVVDSIWTTSDKPGICYGIRGNLSGSMLLETAEAGVHSGITGGVARNPLTELCWVAAQCYDPKTAKVLIPGFYDDVHKVSRREKANFVNSGFVLKTFAAAYRLKKIRVQQSKEAMMRLWCRPTFEVHGVVGGYSGAKVKTAIPPRAELKFSCRLVPNQDPERISKLIQRFVKKLNPDVEVVIHAKLQWYVGDITSSYAKAISDAMKFGFSRSPAFVRSGGSDGAIILLQRYLNAPVLMPGLSLPEHGYHAPNEFFDWGQVAGGIRTFVRYFDTISRFE
ncbi:M20/M25/M40 family metallo-hydrolase [bacterium]|nr:M20/M25/M40 family metallo-hydrolase [bacterium]